MIEQPLPQMPRFRSHCTSFSLALAAWAFLLCAPISAQDPLPTAAEPSNSSTPDAAQPAPSNSAQLSSATTAAPVSPDEAWQQDLDAWRAAREQDISSPSGWLTLVGLDWLLSLIHI